MKNYIKRTVPLMAFFVFKRGMQRMNILWQNAKISVKILSFGRKIANLQNKMLVILFNCYQ